MHVHCHLHEEEKNYPTKSKSLGHVIEEMREKYRRDCHRNQLLY